MSTVISDSDHKKISISLELSHRYSVTEDYPDWWRKIIADGMSAFCELPIPDSKTEGWRETNISHFFNSKLKWSHISTAKVLKETPIPTSFIESFSPHIVYSNGKIIESRLDKLEERGLLVYTLAQKSSNLDNFIKELLISIKESKHVFEAISRAFMLDGLVIEVSRGMVVDSPINIYFQIPEVETSILDTPWLILILGENSQANISVHYIDERKNRDHPVWVNGTEVISVARNAHLKFLSSISGGSTTYRFISSDVLLDRDSSISYNSLVMSGKFVRSELNFQLKGENILSTINGISLNEDTNHSETQQLIEHLQPNCTSRINWRGIGKDESKTIYRGKIYISPDAQKSDSIQLFKGLLLSDRAIVDAKPQLEIYADDVRCTHGATVGPPPHDLLFYFRARGIDIITAKKMLISAFIKQVLGEIPFQNTEVLVEKYLERLYE